MGASGPWVSTDSRLVKGMCMRRDNRRSVLAALLSVGMATTGLCLAGPVMTATSAFGAPASPTTAAPVATGARPGATRIRLSIDDELSASVDVGSGNLMVTSADRAVPSVEGMASFGLAYESLAGVSGSQVTGGAAGAGWFMPEGQDTRLVAAGDGSVLFVAPNGSEGKFVPTTAGGSAYTAPAGFRESLVKNSDGTWTMTDLPSQSKLKFNTDGRLISTTNRNSQSTTFAYSGGNIATATLPTGQVLSFTFEGGKIASVTRPANDDLPAGKVTYGYDGNGRLALITRPAVSGGSTSTTRFTYSAAGDLASITDPLGNVSTFVYDANHRVISFSQGKGADIATTRLVYASATQTLVASPTSDQSASPAATSHTTYALNADLRVTAVTDALGRARSASYTPSFDVASATNGIGGTASATYAADGGPMTKATNAMGSSQSWTYGTGSNAFNPASSVDSQGNSSTMTYSNTGNPASVTDGGGAKASVTYNDDGTVATSTDPAGHITTYTEDAAGKYISKITPPAGSGVGAITISGNPATSVTNGAGETTKYAYNDRYALVSVTTATQAVTFTYDEDGRVLTRTDKNQKVSYSYDVRGEVTSISASPVSGGKAPAASTINYTYDLVGNVTSRELGGSKTVYAYDQGQQLVSMTEPSGAVTRFAYNGAGQRTDTWWRTNPGHTQFVAHTHNEFGVGGNLAQTYTAVNNGDVESSRVNDYSYCYAPYAAGKVCPSTGSSASNTGLIQYMTNNKNGAVTTLGYDKQNRLVTAKNWDGHTYQYSYDAEGNRAQTIVDGKVDQSLTFNSDNEITSAGYSYDKAGRRTADPLHGTTTWNDLGQAVTQTNSRESASGTSSYSGLGQNELITQTIGNTTASYVYGRGNQAGVPSEEQFTVPGGNGSTLVNNDAFGQAIDLTNGSDSEYLIYSGTGALIGTIGSDGHSSTDYKLDPYGAVMSLSVSHPFMAKSSRKAQAAPKATTMQAATSGGESPWTDMAIEGLVSQYQKHGARWADLETGTWTSVDPITVLNNPGRANPYAYVGDDPINQMDPAGLFNWGDLGKATLVGAGAGAAGGFATGLATAIFGPEAPVITAGPATAIGAIGGAVTGAVTSTLNQLF